MCETRKDEAVEGYARMGWGETRLGTCDGGWSGRANVDEKRRNTGAVLIGFRINCLFALYLHISHPSPILEASGAAHIHGFSLISPNYILGCPIDAL
jgi:hypothetical protein